MDTEGTIRTVLRELEIDTSGVDGHTRLREFVLGGATSGVLSKKTQ